MVGADLSNLLNERLERAPVVPLIQANDADVALATAKALLEGGLGVIEVVLRTKEAMSCLQAIATSNPSALVGAGTVLTADQARAAIDAGASFIVSPGLDDKVVGVAQQAGLPVFPGIATATELQHAWNLGLDVVKFFPAGLAGGMSMIKALSSVFESVRFMPTGGVTADNLTGYLGIPSVIACGGSWLTPAAAIKASDYSEITRLAKDALSKAKTVRENENG